MVTISPIYIQGDLVSGTISSHQIKQSLIVSSGTEVMPRIVGNISPVCCLTGIRGTSVSVVSVAVIVILICTGIAVGGRIAVPVVLVLLACIRWLCVRPIRLRLGLRLGLGLVIRGVLMRSPCLGRPRSIVMSCRGSRRCRGESIA